VNDTRGALFFQPDKFSLLQDSFCIPEPGGQSFIDAGKQLLRQAPREAKAFASRVFELGALPNDDPASLFRLDDALVLQSTERGVERAAVDTQKIRERVLRGTCCRRTSAEFARAARRCSG
jgi:hypothetical protein